MANRFSVTISDLQYEFHVCSCKENSTSNQISFKSDQNGVKCSSIGDFICCVRLWRNWGAMYFSLISIADR